MVFQSDPIYGNHFRQLGGSQATWAWPPWVFEKASNCLTRRQVDHLGTLSLFHHGKILRKIHRKMRTSIGKSIGNPWENGGWPSGVISHMAGWTILYEWRFIAGKITYKRSIFQHTLFDYRRVWKHPQSMEAKNPSKKNGSSRFYLWRWLRLPMWCLVVSEKWRN